MGSLYKRGGYTFSWIKKCAVLVMVLYQDKCQFNSHFIGEGEYFDG